MQLVSGPLASADFALPETTLHVDRHTLAKRRWRGVATDGMEFGFELEAPLKPGETVFQSATARYVIAQIPEAVIAVSLDVAPSAAAGIGWAIGNLHLELSAEASRLIAADEPAVRQLLDRLKVNYKPTTAVFRPGRFVRGSQATHDLGPSHQH